MRRRGLLRRLVRPSAFADALLGDLEELRIQERRRLGRIRAGARYWRRLVSVLLHFGGEERAGALQGLTADLRSAGRRWRRSPALALAMIVSLALAIGASTLVFSVVDGVLLRPLPYPEPDSLVLLRSEFPEQGGGNTRTSGPELLDLRAADAFADVGVGWYRPGAMTEDGLEPEDVDMAFVSTGFLEALGIEPLLGRLPTPNEDTLGGPPVVVLAHETWQRRYGGDPEIIGRAVEFDDVPHEVVGVLPEPTRMLMAADVGMPAELAAWVPWGGGYDQLERNWRVFSAVGRLAPGLTLEQTQTQLDSLAAELVARHGDAYGSSGFRWRLERLGDAIVAPTRPVILLIFAAVWLVLLVACANVANLMLGHALHDRYEATVRVALGASGWRVLRQALTDSAVITSAGTAAGVAIALVGIRALPAFAPPDLPRLESVQLNWPTFAFAVAVSVGATAFLSILLARQAGRVARSSTLGSARTTTANGERTRRLLTVAQVAMSMVLLVGAALMLRSFVALAEVDPGYDPDGVVTMKLSLVDSHYPYTEPARIGEFYRQLLQRAEEVPGVEGVGATSRLPLDGSYELAPYAFEGADGRLQATGNTADFRVVTPGWLEAMDAELLAGRTLQWSDTPETPLVAVVDETLAARTWPGDTAVGKRVRIERGYADREYPWVEVVGVVRHLRQHPRLVGDPQVYLSHQQDPARTMSLAIRTRLEAAALLETMRGLIQELNAVQPLQRVRPLTSYGAQAVADTRFALDLLVLTAAIGLLLAAVGTYGILTFAVNQRVREIGVRMAMGASPGDMTRTTLRSGALVIAAGILVGLPVALAFAGLMRGLLFGVSSTDPAIFGGAAVALAAIGLISCWAPARRAAAMSPVEALRTK